ncbi:heme uptake protein IsdC [Bacillus sp. WLY-B-L8]|uniref:heme uptake protein IsdC n=1 Tax=Bacillus multifaciens TaxID=3068506 RepID=UPI0027414380|nr:heme uptake protein IsdC [Bacillus sp. WLY-B-L8]MDP7977344.1 heme uptake protein IsdC [Bacillus sp. WLY-B-L8]
MKKFFALPAFIVTLVYMITFLVAPTPQASAELADGTYDISYVIKKAEDDSASMANDYFEKPAKLIVKNGEMNVQVPMNHSTWITEFKAPQNGGYVDAKVVSSDAGADKRTVEFKVDDLSKPLAAKIHVVVPSANYDHHYTIRFAFDANVKAISGGNVAAGTKVDAPKEEKNKEAATDKSKGNAEKTANPQTGDNTNIVVLVAMLLVSTLFLVRKVKFNK